MFFYTHKINLFYKFAPFLREISFDFYRCSSFTVFTIMSPGAEFCIFFWCQSTYWTLAPTLSVLSIQRSMSQFSYTFYLFRVVQPRQLLRPSVWHRIINWNSSYRSQLMKCPKYAVLRHLIVWSYFFSAPILFSTSSFRTLSKKFNVICRILLVVCCSVPYVLLTTRRERCPD